MQKYGIEPLDLVLREPVSVRAGHRQARLHPGRRGGDDRHWRAGHGSGLRQEPQVRHHCHGCLAVRHRPGRHEGPRRRDDLRDPPEACPGRLLADGILRHRHLLVSGRELGQAFPQKLTLSFAKTAELRYGENPHQKAAFYVSSDASEPCVARAKLLGGKEISYNNYFDANGALELVKDFAQPAVAIIKHANPSGCAVDENLVEAYRKAYLADVNAAMGGIVAVNRPVTGELASAIVESYKRWGKEAGAGGFFAEIIIAPSFEPGALEIIRNREGWGKDVRLLETGPLTPGKYNREKFLKYVVGGAIVQDRDLLGLNESDWKVVTKKQPTPAQLDDLRFAWLVCKHGKSNAIVLAKDRTLLGAGFGQMSRVNSAKLAGMLAKGYAGGGKLDTKGCALASDAFFPFPDSLDWAVESGASAVIEPGGGKKDADVIARADELGLAMIFTGARHFNH